jgi:hypothetical protein
LDAELAPPMERGLVRVSIDPTSEQKSTDQTLQEERASQDSVTEDTLDRVLVVKQASRRTYVTTAG